MQLYVRVYRVEVVHILCICVIQFTQTHTHWYYSINMLWKKSAIHPFFFVHTNDINKKDNLVYELLNTSVLLKSEFSTVARGRVWF